MSYMNERQRVAWAKLSKATPEQTPATFRLDLTNSLTVLGDEAYEAMVSDNTTRQLARTAIQPENPELIN